MHKSVADLVRDTINSQEALSYMKRFYQALQSEDRGSSCFHVARFENFGMTPGESQQWLTHDHAVDSKGESFRVDLCRGSGPGGMNLLVPITKRVASDAADLDALPGHRGNEGPMVWMLQASVPWDEFRAVFVHSIDKAVTEARGAARSIISLTPWLIPASEVKRTHARRYAAHINFFTSTVAIDGARCTRFETFTLAI